MSELRDAETPADGNQKHELLNGIESSDDAQKNVTLEQESKRRERRQRDDEQGGLGEIQRLAPQAFEQQKYEDGNDVLEQKHADDDLAHMAMVQRRGGQQLQTDDRAREHHGGADQEALQGGKTEDQRHQVADNGERERAQQRHARCLAKHLQQLLGVQVEAEQIKKKDDAHVADALDGGGLGDKSDSPGTRKATEGDVGHQHGLTQVQGCTGEHCRTGEDEKDRKDDDVALHAGLLTMRARRRLGSEVPFARAGAGPWHNDDEPRDTHASAYADLCPLRICRCSAIQSGSLLTL